MQYELEYSFGAYIIHEINPKHKYGCYVSKVHRNGQYSFTLDYTYAKSMTKKTALKHIAILESMNR